MHNIELFPPQVEFAERSLSWRQEPTTLRFNPIKPLTLDALKEQLAKCKHDLSTLEENCQYCWFIKINDDFVGQVTLNGFNQMMGTAEIGYIIAETHHGRGFATAAVRVLLNRIFKQTPIRRVVAYVHQQNMAACKVLEKLGFVQEGILREHYIVNELPVNEVVFGLLRSEWSSRDP